MRHSSSMRVLHGILVVYMMGWLIALMAMMLSSCTSIDRAEHVDAPREHDILIEWTQAEQDTETLLDFMEALN